MADGDEKQGRDVEESDDTTFSGPLAPPARLESPPPEPVAGEGGVEHDEEETRLAPLAPDPPEPVREPEERGAEPDAPPASTVAEADANASRTAIAPSASLHPMLVERIEPSLGRGERLRLDAAHWRVSIGRAEHNDLRLYTASASRDHAEIAGNEAGDWVLTPGPGKSVAIDGYDTEEPVVLEVGMNLVFGGDHLRCVTEGLEREQMSASTEAEGLGDAKPSRGSARSWWIIGAIAAVGVALIAWAWFVG